MSEGLRAALRDVVGAESVITDPAVLAPHEVDWTGRFRGTALALVRPGSAAEVAAVLAICAAAGVGVVPQGGNTGLVGGAVPHEAVVLSTRRLNRVGEVDRRRGELRAGAGATLEAVQRAASAGGLAFGVDLAARGTATIGGMIATDAGGIHALRYGSMRRQVVALEAALADGSLVREIPDHDLVELMAGSEGTLAVITEAMLRLVPAWSHRATALVSVADMAAALDVVARVRDRVATVDAVELIDRPSLELVAGRTGVPSPLDGFGPAILIEAAADEPTLDVLAQAIDVLMPVVRDAVIAEDGPGRRRLWLLREGVTEAIASIGIPHKLDVGVPPANLPAFVDRLGPTVEAAHAGARVFVFGHLAVGNLHVNVVGPAHDDERVDDAVLRLVADLGGRIAAEHGIGRAKARWLHLARSRDELAAHAAVELTLDPRGVLNPGVLDWNPVDGSMGNSDTMTRN